MGAKSLQSCTTFCNPIYGLQSTSRLLSPWDSLDKSTGVGCHALLQGIFPTHRLNPGLSHIAGNSLPSEPSGKPIATLESHLTVSVKVQHTPNISSSHSLIDVYPREIKICLKKYTNVYSIFFQISPNQKQSKCLTTSEWIKIMRYVHI